MRKEPDETYNVHNPIEVFEATSLEYPWVHVILKMPVVKGNANAVESKRGKELGIGTLKKVWTRLVLRIWVFWADGHLTLRELVKEEVVLLLAKDL